MNQKQQIEKLKNEVGNLRKTLQENQIFHDGVTRAQDKIIKAYQTAWRRIHWEDQAYMIKFGKQNKDPDLFDVFNRLLYSFGRPDEEGTVFTRLDSWLKQ